MSAAGRIREAVRAFGLARGTILAFLLALAIAAPILGLPLDQLGAQSLQRIGMNLVLALALLPMIRGGTGLNFGLPLGIVAGLLGCVIVLELELTGFPGLALALALGVLIAIPIGALYGLVLTAVKGNEMMVGYYLAWSAVSLFSAFWMLAPFTNPAIIFPIGGRGLRQTLPLRESFGEVLDGLFGLTAIRLGLFLAVAIVFYLVWLFFRTRIGVEVEAAGQNPRFAMASGIRVGRAKVVAVTLGTVLAALGAILFVQSFGLVQPYSPAPMMFALPAIAAVLIGGATLTRATLAHVVIGVALFQSILVLAPPVLTGAVAGADELTEALRITIQNGMILYALTRVGDRS